MFDPRLYGNLFAARMLDNPATRAAMISLEPPKPDTFNRNLETTGLGCRGFGVQGFGVLGFWGLGFGGLGFWGLINFITGFTVRVQSVCCGCLQASARSSAQWDPAAGTWTCSPSSSMLALPFWALTTFPSPLIKPPAATRRYFSSLEP